MMRQLRCLGLEMSCVDLLDAVCDKRVEALPPWQRQRCRHGLPHQLVYETIARIAPAWLGHHQASTFCLFNGVESSIRPRAFQLFKKTQAETSTDHSGSCQHLSCAFTQPVQPPSKHQSNSFRNLELIDAKVQEPLAILVKKFAFFREMAEHLLHKKRIAIGFVKDCTHQ